jgi:Arc/MetJ family transcription regulator
MRTNLEIDDELMRQAMEATGLKTKKATIEQALQQVVLNHRRRQGIESLRGIGWKGDLDAMREGWTKIEQ